LGHDLARGIEPLTHWLKRAAAATKSANSFRCHKSDILCLTLVEKEERLADLANAASGSTHPVTTPEVGVFGAEVSRQFTQLAHRCGAHIPALQECCIAPGG